MAKTNPIGVRFNKELLEKLINDDLARSPQTALNVYEKKFTEVTELEKQLLELSEMYKVVTSKAQDDLINFGVSITKESEGEISHIDPASEEGQNIQEIVSIETLIKTHEDEIMSLKEGFLGRQRKNYLEKQIDNLERRLRELRKD